MGPEVSQTCPHRCIHIPGRGPWREPPFGQSRSPGGSAMRSPPGGHRGQGGAGGRTVAEPFSVSEAGAVVCELGDGLASLITNLGGESAWD